MSADSSRSAHRGALAATAAFGYWGLVPIYWKAMQGVSAFELIAHRVVWSLLFLLAILAWRKSFATLKPALARPATFWSAVLSSVLLAGNWIIYVWAVNSNHVIESSLGYFLTPLCNVALGFAFLHERLRTLQWTAIAFAALGVILLLFHTASAPWIALSLAATWSLYGFFKKRSHLGAIAGLAFETLVLAPLAAGWLLWLGHTGAGALGHVSLKLHVLILLTGIVTTIPLLLFAYATRRIRLATLGVLQYIAPTVQFVIGLWVYREPFDTAHMQACIFIWLGLVLYTADSFWSQRGKLWPVADTA